MTTKDKVITSVSKAHADLEQALADLEHLPTFDFGGIAFAAHALNNFLGVINGTTELLLASLGNDPDETLQRALRGLHHAAHLMSHTVNQLMNTSSSAHPRLVFDDVELPRLVERACLYYENVAAKKRIRIVFSSTEVPCARTDIVAVAAVLDNLLSNAVKYSPPGKSIFVTVGLESGGLICRVRDEGPGISVEDQRRLFQRGVRLSASPTAGEPSTGYGLAVAKELVDNLRGKIWCESELGKGACFCFQVPTEACAGDSADHRGMGSSVGTSG